VTCETVEAAGVVRAAGLIALVALPEDPVAALEAVLAAVLAVPVTASVALLAVPVTALAVPVTAPAALGTVLATPATVLVNEGRTGPGGPELGATAAAAAGVAASRPMPTRMHRPPNAAPTVYKSTFRADRHQPFMRVTLVTQIANVYTRDAISASFSHDRWIIDPDAAHYACQDFPTIVCDACCIPFSHVTYVLHQASGLRKHGY